MEASASKGKKKSRKGLAGGVLLLVLCGMAGRLAYQQSVLSRDPLQTGNLLDTAAYQEDAAAMLRGGPFPPALSTRGPGYPWLLAVVERLGGGTRAVTALQALLDGLSALLIASLAWKIWKKPLPTLAATAFLAASPALIYFSGEILETSWVVFWVALHLRILAGCLDSRRPLPWAAAGATLGFAALVRPNLLLWAAVFVPAAWRARGGRAAAAAAAGVLLLVAPVILQHRFQEGEWTLISPSGGINLWLGNVPDPEIQGRIPYYAHLPGPVPGTLWNRLQQRAENEGATSLVQKDRWFAGQAVTEMTQHPRRSAELLAAKLAAFFNAFPLSNNRDLLRPGSPFGQAFLFPASWGFLLPLAILGIAAIRRGKDARLRWLALFAGVFTLSVVFFFVSPRHEAPVLPALVLLATAGGAALFDRPPPGRLRARRLALVLLLTPLVQIDWFGHRALYAGYEIDPVGTGNLWLERGDPQHAEAAWRRALARLPGDPLALANLASLRLDQGRPKEAETLVRESLRGDPRSAQAHNILGLAFFYQGRLEAAGGEFLRALELDPDYGLAWVNRGRVLAKTGRAEASREAFHKALRLLPAGPAADRVRAILAGRLPPD